MAAQSALVPGSQAFKVSQVNAHASSDWELPSTCWCCCCAGAHIAASAVQAAERTLSQTVISPRTSGMGVLLAQLGC